MPRRKRTSKRPDELTLERWLLLTIGPRPFQPLPTPGDEEWEALRACWFAHRDDLTHGDVEGSWGYRVFELGDVEWGIQQAEGIPVDAAADDA